MVMVAVIMAVRMGMVVRVCVSMIVGVVMCVHMAVMMVTVAMLMVVPMPMVVISVPVVVGLCVFLVTSRPPDGYHAFGIAASASSAHNDTSVR